MQGTITESDLKTIKVYDSTDEALALYYLLNGKVEHNGNTIKMGDISYSIISDDGLFENYSDWIEKNIDGNIITDDEIEVFNYIYNTEGAEAAINYLESIKEIVDRRYVEQKKINDAEWAKTNYLQASLGSIFVTPVEGIKAAIGSFESWIRKDKILRSDVYSAGDIWRAAVGEDITNKYGSTAGFIYSTGMSMADTGVLIGLGTITGGAGIAVLSPTLMGSRSYVSTLNDALDRGLSDGQAIGLAFSSAVVESLMEGYSAGHLLNLEKILGKEVSGLTAKVATIGGEAETKGFYIIAGAISQGLCEGEEEFSTEILNHVLDEYISGDLSSYRLSIKSYVAQGYTEEEAVSMATWDFAGQLGQAFLGGFASGVCFGAFSGAKTSNQISKNIANSIIEEYDKKGSIAFAEGVESARIEQEINENIFEQMKIQRRNEILSNIGKRLSAVTHKANISITESAKNIANNIKEAYISESMQPLYLIPPYMHMFDGLFNNKQQNINSTSDINRYNSVTHYALPDNYKASNPIRSISDLMSRISFNPDIDRMIQAALSDNCYHVLTHSSKYVKIPPSKEAIDLLHSYIPSAYFSHPGTGFISNDATNVIFGAQRHNGNLAFCHFKTQNFDENNIVGRLYINMTDFSSAYYFVDMFINESKKSNVDFYIKTDYYTGASYNNRDDQIVVYLTNDNMVEVTNICMNLQKFFSETSFGSNLAPNYVFDNPPITCGVISNYIGYGNEIVNGESFNRRWSNCVEDTFKQVNKEIGINNPKFKEAFKRQLEINMKNNKYGLTDFSIKMSNNQLLYNMHNIIESTMTSLKISKEAAIKQVEAYLRTGNENLISNKTGGRDQIRQMSKEEIRTTLDLYKGVISQESMEIVFDTINKWGIEGQNEAERIVNLIKTRGISYALKEISVENNAKDIIRNMSVNEIVEAYDVYTSKDFGSNTSS